MNPCDYIPQRAPFLFLDRILEMTDKTVRTEKRLSGEEDFFKGHFPDFPIMPGVLLCEMVFQTGAILAGRLGAASMANGLGVVTKIENTRFKSFARPGHHLVVEVELVERLGNAFYMKGKVKRRDETPDGEKDIAIMSTQFTCALITKDGVL